MFNVYASTKMPMAYLIALLEVLGSRLYNKKFIHEIFELLPVATEYYSSAK
jgi:hypothetical protein